MAAKGSSGPKPGPPRQDKPQGIDLAKLIGSRVGVTTILGDTIEGTVFTLDRSTALLIITEASKTPNVPGVNRLIALSSVQSLTILAPAKSTKSPFTSASPSITPLNVQSLEKRLADSVRREQVAASKVGKNVTKEAQQLFDALERQYDCRWHEKSIVVMDVVIVHPPYTADSCQAKPANENQKKRVQQMIGNIRSRMGNAKDESKAAEPEKQEKGGKSKTVPAVPAGGQRKGG